MKVLDLKDPYREEGGQLISENTHCRHVRCIIVLIALEVSAEDICKDPSQGAVVLFNHRSDFLAHVCGTLGRLRLAVRQKDTGSC